MFDKIWMDTLIKGGSHFGLVLDKKQIEMLTTHATLLIKWNSRFNITAITDPMEMALKHYVDSLAIASHIPASAKVLDMGSGGGFPGIPLKIVRPDLDILMADASRKRVSFLKHVIREIGLSKLQAIHKRVEELDVQKKEESNFHLIVSRAFTSLDRFIRLADRLLKSTGIILAMKGDDPTDTLSREMEDQYRIQNHRYNLPDSDHTRTIVICKKNL